MLLLSDTATLLVKGHILLAQFYNNYPTTTQQKFLLMLLLYINTSIIIYPYCYITNTRRKMWKDWYFAFCKPNLFPITWILWVQVTSKVYPYLYLLSDIYASTCMLLFSHQVLSNSLQPHGLGPTRLLCPRNYPG